MEPNTVEQESSLNSVVANSSSFQEAVKVSGAGRKGEILFAARNCKKLSPEMGGSVMGQIRHDIYQGIGINDEAGFEKFLKEKAAEERGIPEGNWETFSQVAGELREIENSPTSSEEARREAGKKYNKALGILVSQRSPAAFVLHFWKNGDLKWLTGLTEESRGRDFTEKTDAGRLFDGLGGELAQFAAKTGRRW